MIKTITSLYFDGKDKGIILDNAYDLHIRNQFSKYIKENSINYLRCQDTDINLLTFFPNVEFITLPEDAENIEGLYNLKKLRGLEISSRNLEKLDLFCFSDLEYLIISDYSKEHSYKLQSCKQLKHICIIHSDISSLESVAINSELESLHLEFCYNLKKLDGIQSFKGLKRLILDYCLKLENVSVLCSLADSINYLRITDCNKIQGLIDVLSKLTEIKTLYLSTSQTSKVNNLRSVGFVKKLTKLEDFMTNYKIEDGDLAPLLNVKQVDVLRFYK